MKIIFFLQCLLIGSSSALLKITVQDGQYSDIYGLKPTASWSNSEEIGDVTIDYGIEADIRITKDISNIASLPKKIWGKVSSKFDAWGVSARADLKGLDYTNADVEIGVTNDDQGITLTLDGSCGSQGAELKTIQGTKSFEYDGGNIVVNPSYDIASDEATVLMSYEKGGMGVDVEASKDAQSVTLSRQVDDENLIRPTFSSSGEISIDWEHKSNDCTITTTFKPEKSINVMFEEGGWNANILMDLEKADITNVKVSVKRDVVF